MREVEPQELPTDWINTDIGSFAPLQRGFDLPNRERIDGKYPVVYSNGVMNYHHKYQVKGPGVVTGRSGTIGKVHYVEKDYWPHNTALWVKEFNNASPKFVYYLYSYIGFERFSSGSGVPTLNRNDAHSFAINVPENKEEQTAIANALSDVDALLSELENLIAKKQAIKTATMQQLLTGKTRLPQFALYSDINSTEGAVEGKRNNASATNVNAGASDDGSLASQERGGMDSRRKGIKPSELGEIPEDWEVAYLGDIAELTSSKRIFESDYVSDGIPFFRGKEVSSLLESKDIENLIYISKTKYNALKARYGAPKPGEILITAVGTLGNAFLIQSEDPFYFKDGNLIWIKKIKGCSPEYLINQLNFNKSRVLGCAIGSSQKALTMVSLSPLPIAIPTNKEEQTAIAAILSDMDNEIQTLEQRLSKTRQIKQGMMQELLTGKTRLPFARLVGESDAD
jgi:restriction endonuclease S subunit